MKVPLFKPHLGKSELNAIKEIFETGWIGLGPKTAKFEKQFCDYLNVKACIGTNSATSALDLSIKIFDFVDGEVLVPSITFASTDTNTTYSAGTGISLAGTTFALNAAIEDLTNVSSTSPTSGQVLKWDGSQWAPGTDSAGAGASNSFETIAIALKSVTP